jgi:hypothetical protein
MKKLSGILLSLVFITACTSNSGSDNQPDPNHPQAPGEEGRPDTGSQTDCKFGEVKVPADINQYLPEGVDPEVQGGFQTPECKTVIVGFSKTRQRFVMLRLVDGKLDTTFGNEGSKIIDFLKQRSWIYGKLKFFREGELVFMVGAAGSDRSSGFALGSFDLSGEFIQKSFNQGAAYVDVWRAPLSGSWCNQFSLEVSKVNRMTPMQVGIEGLFHYCGNEAVPVSKVMNIRFPEVTDLKKAIPSSCGDFNYRGGAIDGSVHEFKASADCRSITVNYHSLYPPYPTETIRISTDGKCLKSDRYSYSCFYYENDYLVREYVNLYWQNGKSYLKVVKDHPYLCQVSGSSHDDGVMVESPYPPTDPKFYSQCNYY